MKVLLLGDSCNDIFVEGGTSRLSPEVPVPVFIRGETRCMPGMGGNVLANLQSLRPGIQVKAILGNGGAKIRFLDAKTGHHFLRIDEELSPEPLSPVDLGTAFEADNWDAVVVSDYNKGFLRGEVLLRVAQLCHEQLVPLFVDTKRALGAWTKNAIVKINDAEYARQMDWGLPWELCASLVVTSGAHGMSLVESGNTAYHVPAVPIQVRDGAGCGDSVLAALVVAYCETGGDLKAAMRWAAKAGAVAVSKRGVVAVPREEIA